MEALIATRGEHGGFLSAYSAVNSYIDFRKMSRIQSFHKLHKNWEHEVE